MSRAFLPGMGDRTVRWAATEDGYAVWLRHGIRIICSYTAECIAGEVARELAKAKTVELALEYRVSLGDVAEDRG